MVKGPLELIFAHCSKIFPVINLMFLELYSLDNLLNLQVDDEVAAKKHQQLVNSLSTLAGGKR